MTTRKRLFTFIRIFFGIALDFRKEFKLIRKKGYKAAQDKMRKRHEKRATEFYDAAIELKGALIKLGQFFSTRVDAFPEPYIRILKPLQDDLPPVAYDQIENILQNEYDNYKSVIREIDKNPIASASIAQVHRAVLSNGKEALLKILKPEAEYIFDIDFSILYFVFDLFSHFKFFRENMQFTVILKDFILVTGDELNFIREAHVAGRFREYFHKYDYIVIPEIYYEFCTSKVIVMEYLKGDKISERDAWTGKGMNPEIIARRIIEFYAEQIFYFEYTHFDPHPGNILVMNNDAIGILDFGMSGAITDEMKSGLREALNALIKKDAERMILAFDSLGFFTENINKSSLENVIKFIFDSFYDIFENIRLDREAMQSELMKMDFRPVLDNLIEIIYTTSITLPTNWIYLGKTLGSLSGLIASLNPEIKIFDELKPYINKFISGNYGKIIKNTFDTLVENLSLLARLPKKVDHFIKAIESGKMEIKVDSVELESKLDELRIFVVRLLCSSFFIVSGILSYFFIRKGNTDLFIIFLVIGILSFFFGIFYRKKSKTEKIRKHIEKMW